MAFVIPLTMKYGALGAAFGMMLAGFLIVFGSLYIAQSHFKIEYEWRKVLSIMFVFTGFSLSLVILKLYENQYIWTLYLKLLGLGMYLWLGIKFKIISKENAQLVKIFKNR